MPSKQEPMPTVAYRAAALIGFALVCVVAAVVDDLSKSDAAASVVAVIGMAALVVGIVRWYVGGRRRWVAARRRQIGLCAACGYDLHESVSVCGECGTPVPMGHRPLSEAAEALERM